MKQQMFNHLQSAFDQGMHLLPVFMDEPIVVYPSGRQSKASRKDSHGYTMLDLTVNGQTRTVRLHTLICWWYHGPPPTIGHIVDHIDGNAENNAAKNLKWSRPSETCKHVREESHQSRRDAAAKNFKKGGPSNVSSWKLGDRKTRDAIRRNYIKGMSMAKLAKKYGVGERAVSRLLSGETYRQDAAVEAADPTGDHRRI